MFAARRVEKTCPACGEQQRRTQAKFCRTCGRSLAVLSYLPTDNLRASYRTRHAPPAAVAASSKIDVPPKSMARQKIVQAHLNMPDKPARASLLADAEQNTWAAVAVAFTTYALVPYLGILFCPGAFVAGGLGLARAQRLPQKAGQRAARLSVWLSLAICFAQLLLWWILFSVPDWNK